MAADLSFVETGAAEQRRVLCLWVEHFYESGSRVQVVTDSSQAARQIDEMLWTFSEESFVAHRLLGRGDVAADADGAIPVADLPERVVITEGELLLDGVDVLVCDGRTGLEFMKRYPVVLHFVVRDDEERRDESRALWQRAREEGLTVRHVQPSAAPFRSSPGRR